MSGDAAHLNLARLKTIGFWLLKLLLAALFIFTGGAKLAGLPAMVDVFEHVGFGQWFRYLTALLELGGAGLLLRWWYRAGRIRYEAWKRALPGADAEADRGAAA